MNRAFEKELSRALAQPHRKRCCAAAGRNMS